MACLSRAIKPSSWIADRKSYLRRSWAGVRWWRRAQALLFEPASIIAALFPPAKVVEPHRVIRVVLSSWCISISGTPIWVMQNGNHDTSQARTGALGVGSQNPALSPALRAGSAPAKKQTQGRGTLGSGDPGKGGPAPITRTTFTLDLYPRCENDSLLR